MRRNSLASAHVSHVPKCGSPLEEGRREPTKHCTPFLTNIGRYDTAVDTSYRTGAQAIGFNCDGKVGNETNPGWTVHNHYTWGTGLLLAPAMALTRLVAPENSGFNPWGYSLVNTMSILGYVHIV